MFAKDFALSRAGCKCIAGYSPEKTSAERASVGSRADLNEAVAGA
jgi:hypothetical protein